MTKGMKKQKFVVAFPSEYDTKKVTITFVKRDK